MHMAAFGIWQSAAQQSPREPGESHTLLGESSFTRRKVWRTLGKERAGVCSVILVYFKIWSLIFSLAWEIVWREKRGRRKLLCSCCSKPGIAHCQFISEEAWPVHKVTWLFTVENELWLQEAKGKECTEYVTILPGSLHQCLLAASVWYEKLKHWVSIETNILSV